MAHFVPILQTRAPDARHLVHPPAEAKLRRPQRHTNHALQDGVERCGLRVEDIWPLSLYWEQVRLKLGVTTLG